MEINNFNHMKNKLNILIAGAMLLLLGCQTPDDLIPSTANNGINSISAFFTDEDGNILDENQGKFTATVTEGNQDIVIPISYYYPESSDNQVTEEMLVHMRVKANLDDNVTISPSLLYLDLSAGKKYTFTVVDQMKRVHEYTIRGEIRKSAACAIEEFSLPEFSISGIINETTKTISLVSAEDLSSAVAEYKLSPHATISPDPRTTALNYNEDQTFTVTADNGTTQATYTVKKTMPDKISSGIRPGSAKVLFAKKLITDLNVPLNKHAGIAATPNFVVINTESNQSIVINPKTGVLLSPLDVSAITGNNNRYNTADDGGNILICNLSQDTGTFKVWTLSSLSDTPKLFIDWSANTTYAVGRKLSVRGNINSDAIITAPLHNATNKFARWKVTGGVLQSHTPDIITVSGISWTNHVDVVYTSATNINADYFIARTGDGYGSDNLTYSFLNWINGATNTERKYLTTANNQWNGFLANAVDYTVFNNIPYVLINYVNAWDWGQSDQVYLVQAGSVNEFEAPSPFGNNNDISGALVWMDGLSGGYSKYSYVAAGLGGEYRNVHAASDVAFAQSPDGFFLYVYFMFTNGYIVGVQFDCVDI